MENKKTIIYRNWNFAYIFGALLLTILAIFIFIVSVMATEEIRTTLFLTPIAVSIIMSGVFFTIGIVSFFQELQGKKYEVEARHVKEVNK